MSIDREQPGAETEAAGEDRPADGGSIGVDQWVAQSDDRRDQGAGWRRVLARADARIGWWPRLALVAILGLAFAQLSTNVNIQTVAFNSLLYALLAMGLNIAVGWSGLLDLGYIASFGFGAYGYAIFSSTALGTDGVGKDGGRVAHARPAVDHDVSAHGGDLDAALIVEVLATH